MDKAELGIIRCLLAVENWRAWRAGLAACGLVFWLIDPSEPYVWE
jgi:hypothetical protein